MYASESLSVGTTEVMAWADHVALLHSPRAAERFASLVDGAGLVRQRMGIAALSPAVAMAAGAGWQVTAVAQEPTDDQLVAAAAALIDPLAAAADKRA